MNHAHLVQQFEAWLARTEDEIRDLGGHFDEDLAGQAAEQQAPDQEIDDGESHAGPLQSAVGPHADYPGAGFSSHSFSAEEPRVARHESAQVGLFDLAEAFTALRHEIKLQTKSSRGLEETVDTSLKALDRAIQHMQGVQSREDEAAKRVAVPLIESLVELDEALVRGRAAFEATERRLLDDGPQRFEKALDEKFSRLSGLQRWLSRSWHRQAKTICCEQAAEIHREMFGTLDEGYNMILGRVARLLDKHGIRRIDCVGRRVDPEQMTVVELVVADQAEPETVVEEVRPGYLWRDRVIRYAEVKATRAQ